MRLRAKSSMTEVTKYDELSFGEKLQYACKSQLSGFSGVGQHQDGVPDPFQDQRQDPWHGQSSTSDDVEGKKEKKPKELLLSTPSPKKGGVESPPPGLAGPKTGDMTLDSITKPSNGVNRQG